MSSWNGRVKEIARDGKFGPSETLTAPVRREARDEGLARGELHPINLSRSEPCVDVRRSLGTQAPPLPPRMGAHIFFVDIFARGPRWYMDVFLLPVQTHPNEKGLIIHCHPPPGAEIFSE